MQKHEESETEPMDAEYIQEARTESGLDTNNPSSDSHWLYDADGLASALVN